MAKNLLGIRKRCMTVFASDQVQHMLRYYFWSKKKSFVTIFGFSSAHKTTAFIVRHVFTFLLVVLSLKHLYYLLEGRKEGKICKTCSSIYINRAGTFITAFERFHSQKNFRFDLIWFYCRYCSNVFFDVVAAIKSWKSWKTCSE